MARVDGGRRSVRDALVLICGWAAASYRAIGARCDVALSVRGVQLVLRQALKVRGPR